MCNAQDKPLDLDPGLD